MSLRKTKQPTADAAPAGNNGVTASDLTEQFATEYAKSAVPNMLKAIETVKRYNRITLIGAMVTSYLHQAHYLASIGAGVFAYLPPAIFDTAMVAMLITMRTHGIAKEAKRLATFVFCCLALLSATVNFASPGKIGLRIIFALVVTLVIGVELVAGRIRPDFEAIEKHAAELLAAANRIKASTATNNPTPQTETADQKPASTSDTAAIEKPTTPTSAPAITSTIPSAAITERRTSTDDIPARFLAAARMVVVQHRQTSTEPLTADELAARLNTTPAMAGQLLDTINGPAHINGNTPVLGGTR
jgi:hypothetical protein